MTELTTILPFLIWAASWAIGGYLIAWAVFDLQRERFVAGLALGLVLQLWLANALTYAIPAPSSFWASAGAVLLFGLIAMVRSRRRLQRPFSLPIGQALALAVLTYVFLAVERGLNIFDDFQNIPTASTMAAGDIPPHFPYAPHLRFGYHYLLLLFAAQLIRLGDLFPWTAVDLARAVVLALLLVLTYVWAGRMARSRLAGGIAATFVAFAGGARWLLLLLPEALSRSISRSISLIGSGAASAPDLMAGLTAPWRIEGDGPIPFPFAFANGINNPTTMAHGGVGALYVLIPLLLLVLFRRLRNLSGGLVLITLIASHALTVEFDFLVMYAALGLVLLLDWVRRRKVGVLRSFWTTAAVAAGALPIAAVQGGVLTELVRERLLTADARQSFHTFQFSFSTPSLVSGHLGWLELLHPYPLVAALLELGPVLLATPLLFAWGGKMIRVQKWWEAGIALGGVFVLLPLFVKYAGSAGQSANARLFGILLQPAPCTPCP